MKKSLICTIVMAVMLVSFSACTVSNQPTDSASATTSSAPTTSLGPTNTLTSGEDINTVTLPSTEVPNIQLSATNGNSTKPAESVDITSDGLKQSALDYAFGYWPEGYKGKDRDFHIRTGYYGITLDTITGKINRIGAFSAPKTESQAALDDNEDMINLPGVDMDYSIVVNGREYAYDGIEYLYEKEGQNISIRMAESGKYMQHFDLMKLKFKNKEDMPGHLEVACLGNYFVMSFGVYPKNAGAKTVLKYSLTLDEQFNQVTWNSDRSAVTVKNSSGQGYTFVSIDGNKLDIEGSALKITSEEMTVRKNTFNSSKVVVIPANNASIADALMVQNLYNNVVVSATNVNTSKYLPVTMDDQPGVFSVVMQSTTTVGTSLSEVGYNDNYNNLRINVTNNSDQAMRVPIQFYKKGTGIFCVAPIIRDSETGEPMGLPVQVSINFHAHEDYGIDDPRYYMTGMWMRYYTVVEVPAGESITFDFTGTLARWGGVPAVTHQQISLIGWGGYQQWEHEYTTAGGSLCYDMVRGWNGSNFADAYPNYVTMKDDNGNDVLSLNYWNNVGGGDFLFYTRNGKRTEMAQVKTQYRLNGPNLNETIYTGYTADFKVKVEMKAYMGRDNAITQIIHYFKYTFLEDVKFDRMVFYQSGADTYTYAYWKKMAVGNIDGLVSFDIDKTEYNGVFDVPSKGYKAYVGKNGTMQRLDLGTNLWTAMIGTERGKGYSDRVMSVHSYNATINGVWYDRPTLSILSTTVNGDSCISELTPPKEAGNVIQAGSVVEGTVGYIILPGAKSEYGGDSKIIKGLPDEMFDTWEMAYLFATQSGTTVTATNGEVVRNFPAAVKSTGVTNGVAAQFTIKKGIGYVPISIKNLPDYKNWILQKKVNGTWADIDQSVNGNDFWQCYYDPDTKSYELIFNVEHNGNNDSAEYRLIRI